MSNLRRNLAVQLIADGQNAFKITLEPPTVNIKFGTILTAGMLSLVGHGGTLPYAFVPGDIGDSSASSGLSINADGTITGTASGIGRFEFIAEGQDSSSPDQFYQGTFEVTVDHILQPKNASPTPFERNYPYSYTFSVLGSTGTVTWSTSGSLPTGISINSSTGELSGLPTSFAPNDFSFTVTAHDSGTGDSIDMHFVVHLYSELKTTPSTTHELMTVGIPLTLQSGDMGWIGGANGVSLRLTTTLPDGLSYRVFPDGSVTWTATAPFSSTFIQFDVTDGIGFNLGLSTGFYLTAVTAIPSGDANNALQIGTDGALFVAPSSGGDSGGPFGQSLFYRLDDITTSSGNDEIFLTNVPYDDTVTTAKIFVQQTTSDGFFLWEEIYPQAGSTYSSTGLVINSSGIYFPISPAFAGEKIRVEYWSAEAASASSAQTSVQNYLDQLGINPVMAQALKRVISTYNGNLIDVTNSSGTITGSIGMDGGGNLDVTSLVALSAGGDLFISKWYDQTGNGYDLLYGSAATAPPIVASGAYIGYIHFGRVSGNFLEIGVPGVTFAATGFAGIYFAGFATNPGVVSVNNETNSAWTGAAGGFITVSNGTGTPTYELGFASFSPNRLLGFALSPYTSCTYWTNLIDTSQTLITDALKSFVNGSQQTNTGTLNDDGITGTHFGTFLYNLGARSGNTLPSQMEITSHVLYDQDTSSIRSTIEALIA